MCVCVCLCVYVCVRACNHCQGVASPSDAETPWQNKVFCMTCVWLSVYVSTPEYVVVCVCVCMCVCVCVCVGIYVFARLQAPLYTNISVCCRCEAVPR